MGIVVIGSRFLWYIKGYPLSTYIPGGATPAGSSRYTVV